MIHYLTIYQLLNLGHMSLTDLVYGYLMDYLNSRKQRTKVGSSYRKWSKIKHGIPQGSIVGALLINIFINDNSLS